MKQCILTLICFFTMSCTLNAQVVAKNWTVKDGLPHDITYQITQDSLGYIWIGTDDGLARFNGNEFKIYTISNGLQSNYVINVIKKEETLVLGTWGGGLHLKNKDTISALKLNSTLKVNKIGLLEDDKLFVNSINHNFLIYDFKTNSFSPVSIYKEENSATKIQLKTEGTIIDKHIYVHAGYKKLEQQEYLYGLHQYIEKKITSIIPPLNKKLITSVYKHKDEVFAASNSTIYHIKDSVINSIYSLNIEDTKIIKLIKKGNLIYCIGYNTTDASRKLYCYNTVKKTLINISKSLAITSFISDVLFDNEDNIWVSTYGQGVYLIKKTENLFLDAHHFENPDIKDVFVKSDTIFALSTNKIYALHQQKKVGTLNLSKHIEKLNTNKNTTTLNAFSVFSQQIESPKVGDTPLIFYKNHNFTYKKDSTTIVLSNRAIHIYNNEKFIKKIEFKGTLQNYSIENQQIYLQLYKRGMMIYDFKGDLKLELSKNTILKTNRINDYLTINDSEIYLATDSGLYHYSNGKIVFFTTKNGLLSNHINSLCKDKHNVIWIGSQRGVNVKIQDAIYTYTKDYKQQSSFITKIEASNNTLYVAGNKGIYLIENTTPFLPKSNSQVSITPFKSSFVFDVVNYTNYTTLVFQYKLNNGSWKNFKLPKIDFKHLAQNDYTVLFRYKDASSNWNTTQPYSFKLTKPWHQQWWFYLALVFIVISILFYVVHKRLEESKAKTLIFKNALDKNKKLHVELANVRHKIAQDFHDDLGNKLASIAVLSRQTKSKKYGPIDVSEKLDKINVEAESLYTTMRDFVWSLDKNNNKLSEIIAYLNDFGEQLFRATDILFYCSHHLIDDTIELPPYWNKQLILIFKEAMTNALKHSDATQITLSILQHKNQLKFSIQDDGVGIKENNLKSKRGMYNMQQRAQSIGGKLEIVNNTGCFVKFEIELIS